ncbi:hypothetical protein [Pseudozobellia thermophila]|uniref:Uncharacterized protein n=1 Tax=Pseudozobellia thermophila TaxID=192903 RepID=A0A1M6G530_9FLAO|nr:hypothetical protein [Pseudozobellia thermophila]SHJ05000.1 hypothetical protein SAMN04488513_102679 [Pseudozobellia thermophila]
MKPYQLTIAILFLVITLASTLKIAGTLGYYMLFTENFIETLCENKDRPELHCDGKCALSQMIASENDKNDGINLDFLKIETVLFLHTVSEIQFPFTPLTPTFDVAYTDNYRFHLTDRIKHPPRV